jgi:hypothetical protein
MTLKFTFLNKELPWQLLILNTNKVFSKCCCFYYFTAFTSQTKLVNAIYLHSPLNPVFPHEI